MEFLNCLFRDQITFPAIQFCFLLLAAYAWARDRGLFTRQGSVTLSLKRGEESWNQFNLAYGILAVVFLQAINTTDAWKGYKTIVTVIDLSLLLYLCFFNGWFRNKIVGVVHSSKNMVEK